MTSRRENRSFSLEARRNSRSRRGSNNRAFNFADFIARVDQERSATTRFHATVDRAVQTGFKRQASPGRTDRSDGSLAHSDTPRTRYRRCEAPSLSPPGCRRASPGTAAAARPAWRRTDFDAETASRHATGHCLFDGCCWPSWPLCFPFYLLIY